MLSASDVREIEEIEKEYLTDEFILGNNPRYTKINKMRIEGVGELEARLDVSGGIIKAVNLLGDYFLVGDLNADIISPLIGQPYDLQHISQALPEHTEFTIRNLNKNQLIDLFYGKQENMSL